MCDILIAIRLSRTYIGPVAARACRGALAAPSTIFRSGTLAPSRQGT